MENQKLENLLNLALGATPQERERSENLQVGYDPEERTWELIVKHSEPLPDLTEIGVEAQPLLNNYSIIVVPESQIDFISQIPQVEYIEKPKRLYFAVNEAKTASCIDYVQVAGSMYTPYLTGKGTIVAVIDSGIDYFHQDFRNEDGSTRIGALWDQGLGRVFTREEINQALEEGDRIAARNLVPSVDASGHGTAVAGIAAGNGRESQGQYQGVAYESELLVVKLGVADPLGFPRTTELMKALDYVVRYGVTAKKPVAVNISFGNTYGSHEGTSLLETYIDGISNYGRTSIAVGTGNEGTTSGHTSGIMSEGQQVEVELSISPYETGLSV